MPAAWSDTELLQHKDFAEFTAAERELARTVHGAPGRPGAAPRQPPHAPLASRRPAATRRSRRSARARRGRRCARGGEPVERHWREPRERPRPVVLVCDVSGSMEPYARMLLMYMQACVAARRRVEAFAFGTRLTRVTGELAGRDPERALERASGALEDWSGGTRIGDALATLNREHGAPDRPRRGGGGAVRRLGSRRPRAAGCRDGAAVALPRTGWCGSTRSRPRPDYEPLVRGMVAALPHVDRFLAGNTLASLEELAELMEEGRCEGRGRGRARWTGRGARVAMATVVGVKRSAPRPPGAKMAVNDAGEVSGAVSGGCVEGAVVEAAAEVLAGGGRSCCTSASPTPRPGTSACPAAGRSTCSWRSTASERREGEFAQLAATGGPRRHRHGHRRAPGWGRSCWCARTAPARAASATPSWRPRPTRPRAS